MSLHTYKMKVLVVFLSFGLMCQSPGTMAATSPHQAEVEATWFNLRPAESSIVDYVVLFYHDGSFDLYNNREPASPILQRLVNRVPSTVAELEALVPGSVVAVFRAPHEPIPDDLWRFDLISTREVVILDPQRHRHVSAFIALRPGNDAFLANENPYRIELFDLSGSTQLPLSIDFFGSEVLDAGLCENNESFLYLLDTAIPGDQACQPENGVVRTHPGYNGSIRNPLGVPKRILGATSADMGGVTGLHHYDEVATDFTRPGAKIGRLVFNLERSIGSQSGSWYSPSRSGEGFNIEMYRRAGSNRDEMLVYWYTYDPTGRPLWLVGSGDPMEAIQMYSAHGGRLGSPSNPANVVREYWGTLSIGLNEHRELCPDLGAVTYTPADTTQAGGRYEIQRLTPRSDSSQRWCDMLFPRPVQEP